MRFHLPLVIFTVLLFSCSNKADQIDLVKYEGAEQLLTLNNLTRYGVKIEAPLIRRVSPDSIMAGEELQLKLFLGQPNLKIIEAFFDCQSVRDAAVDTTTYNVRGCSKRLFIQGDTILVGFRPTKIGLQNFPEITILTRGDDKVFRTYDYSFQYRVIRNQQ